MKRSYHLFEFCDAYYLFDFYNIAIFQVTKDLFSLISENYEKDYDSFVAALQSSNVQYVEEILELLQEGFLYSDENQWELEDRYNKLSATDSEITLSISMGEGCNLGCDYCYRSMQNGHKDSSAFSLNQVELQIKDLFEKYEKVNLSLSNGGEPFLYKAELKELCNLITTYRNQGYNISLTAVTNGTIHDEEILHILSDVNAIMVVSIDGSKETHNLSRKTIEGTPTYDLVVETLRQIRSQNSLSHTTKNVWSSSMVTSNTKSLVNDLKSLHDIGIHTVQFKIVKGMNKSIGVNDNNLNHFISLYNELFNFLEQCISDNVVDYFMMLLNNGDSAGALMIFLLLEEKRYKRCYASTQTLGASNDGSIYPCMFFTGSKNMIMGNDIKEALSSDMHNVFLNTDIFFSEKCMECWARTICGGWCPYHSAVSCGDFKVPDDNICQLTKYIIEREIRIISLLETNNLRMYERLCSYCNKRRNLETKY